MLVENFDSVFQTIERYSINVDDTVLYHTGDSFDKVKLGIVKELTSNGNYVIIENTDTNKIHCTERAMVFPLDLYDKLPCFIFYTRDKLTHYRIKKRFKANSRSSEGRGIIDGDSRIYCYSACDEKPAYGTPREKSSYIKFDNFYVGFELKTHREGNGSYHSFKDDRLDTYSSFSLQKFIASGNIVSSYRGVFTLRERSS